MTLSMTLDYFLRRALKKHASRTAIIDGSRVLTYADLDRRSNAIARYLSNAGLDKDDRIAVLMHNRSEFIETELGIVKAGLVKVPINNRLSIPEIVQILEDSGARAIALEPEFQNDLLAHTAKLPEFKLLLSHEPVVGTVVDLRTICDGDQSDLPPAHRSPDEVCSIRYSGGTTGKPKGIMHSGASLVAIALAVTREYPLTSSDVFLHVAHLSHGQNFVWPALIAQGAKLVMIRRFDPLEVLKNVQEHRVTRLHMVPTMMDAVFGHPQSGSYDLSSLRAAVYASAPMAPEQVKRLYAKLGPRISQVYTLSESAVVTTMLTVEDHELDGSAEREGRLSSCGREVLDVELRIVGDTMNELPPHEVGEIAIRSPGNMMGYWQQPALTQRTLRDGWVLTGDLGRKDEAGYVFLVDRKDDKIITGGFNVYPREVEEILYRHDAVREAAVVGVPDERWGEAIIAVVALYPGKACSDIDLIEFCSQHLAGYKKPKRIVIQDDLPKSPVGKILRRAVREPFWEGKTRRIN
jgi:acyl-CoA synthetase (AMP-forming)/AMP-acid ligase II